jgi:hypothetical protein
MIKSSERADGKGDWRRLTFSVDGNGCLKTLDGIRTAIAGCFDSYLLDRPFLLRSVPFERLNPDMHSLSVFLGLESSFHALRVGVSVWDVICHRGCQIIPDQGSSLLLHA